MKNKSLFHDDPVPGDQVQLKVNESFAKRFEHNKKREELHKLKEKYPEVAARMNSKRATLRDRDESGSSSSSDGEDDDQGYISNKTEAQILETLVKIRRKDKSIYDENAKFYSSDEEDDDDATAKKKKKEKPMFLKDVVYKEAMERAAGEASESDDDENHNGKEMVKTYTQEQDELKNAFLSAFEKDIDEEEESKKEDAFGGVLKPKSKQHKVKKGGKDKSNSNSENDDTDDDEDARVQHLLNAYFDGDTASKSKKKRKGDHAPVIDDEADKFLKDFILNKAWIDQEDDHSPTHHAYANGNDDATRNPRRTVDGEAIDVDEDEAAWLAAQNFEANYNFRFEEPGGSQLATYPRILEGTVRKEDDRRKRKRAEKAEKKAAEEERRRAEIRRFKNLKKSEIESKLDEVRTVAGAGAPPEEILDELLAGEFDPEAHDRAMAAAFGDSYYGEDEDEDDLADEEFERELQAMADCASDEDDEKAQETFAGMQRKLAAGKKQDGDDNEEEEEDGAAADAVKADIKRLFEEYHKLNYEDFVGGIPTRFRYKQTEPEDYGLSIEEILGMDDKELNQVIGLKRVTATYRQGKARPNYGVLNTIRKERSGYQGGGGGRGSFHQGRERYSSMPRTDTAHARGNNNNNNNTYYRHNNYNNDEKFGREEITEKEKRLATFAPPTLKKIRHDGAVSIATDKKKKDKEKEKKNMSNTLSNDVQEKKKEKEKRAAVNMTMVNDKFAGLTKAQKKNLKRSEKRAGKKPTTTTTTT